MLRSVGGYDANTLVIVSPFRRALQTAAEVLGDDARSMKTIVAPLAAEHTLYRSAVQKGDRGSTATHLVPCLSTLTQRHNRNHSRKKNKTRNRKKHITIMDLNVEFCDETHVIEVALADAVEDMRRKVASAVGLPEDSFGMSFGDKAMGEGADMTQLSAGDTIVVKKSMKGWGVPDV